MRGGSSRFSRLTTPAKFWSQRLSLIVLVLLAVGLMIFSRTDTETVRRAQAWMHDAAAPFLDMFSQPVSAVESGLGNLRSFVTLARENARLRQEIRQLRGWETVARRLDHENQTLRSLLGAKAEGLGPVIAGRVIGDSAGPYVRAMLVNAGRGEGVRKNRTVTDGRNVVGRVLTVGLQSSRVLLLTDLNSRIPVMIERTGDRAILAGDNTALPVLRFLPVDTVVRAGDRVLTSGEGGVFPPRLPVGQVVRREGAPRVQPFADLARLEYVLVLDYHFPSLRTAKEAGS